MTTSSMIPHSFTVLIYLCFSYCFKEVSDP